ncbi:MAG: 50S ribosomal protein L5 [Candidatus Marsarchaeota archaeon]|nr:50S ribosomal protein L5 [Candidatus Marsarchaeota archaeon]MCL5413125.1 50S ribosomal protein L5 [Candidatus Marsarchaeota archaeon]
MAGSNIMQNIFIDKVVLNIGIGSNEEMYQNARLLLEKLTDGKPVPNVSKKRRPELKLRKGQVIGAMVTLRNEKASEMLKRAIEANDSIISGRSISNNSLSFGVKEYIYFSGVKYDPKIGMLGLNVNVSFTRPGRRIEERRRSRSAVGRKHKSISSKEITSYVEKSFGAKVEGER